MIDPKFDDPKPSITRRIKFIDGIAMSMARLLETSLAGRRPACAAAPASSEARPRPRAELERRDNQAGRHSIGALIDPHV